VQENAVVHDKHEVHHRLREEVHSNAKSFYIQIHIPENTKMPQQILYRNKIVKFT
jgi:hypothetical protein